MTSFTYRMGAGAAGEVTRTHPASIMTYLNDSSNPVTLYGYPCLFNGSANDVRGIESGDQSASATQIAGWSARPYPQMGSTSVGPLTTAGYGDVAPPTEAPIDVLVTGSILVPVVGTPNLGGAVYVWCAANSGSHVQGGCEASSSGGNTLLIAGAYFNGPPDANGIGEIVVRNP